MPEKTRTLTTGACLVCGKSEDFTLTESQYQAFMSGTSLQKLRVIDNRVEKLIITGTHPECWADYVRVTPKGDRNNG